MIQTDRQPAADGIILFFIILLNAVILEMAYTGNSNWYWCLVVTIPLLALIIWDKRQQKHGSNRNVPITRPLRDPFDATRPELQRYYFKSDAAVKPFSSRQQPVAHARAGKSKRWFFASRPKNASAG